jgi:hypothetical protein
VPHGERLGRLNEIAREKNVSQSKAEKARAEYNRFLELANQDAPSVALGGALKTRRGACPPFAHAIGLLQMACDLTPNGGLHH